MFLRFDLWRFTRTFWRATRDTIRHSSTRDVALEHLGKLCALVCNNISCLKVDPTFTEEEEQLKKEKDKETPTAASTGQDKEK